MVVNNEFKLEINSRGNKVVVSGDLSFSGGLFTAKLHNNSNEFTGEDSDTAIIAALASFLEVQI